MYFVSVCICVRGATMCRKKCACHDGNATAAQMQIIRGRQPSLVSLHSLSHLVPWNKRSARAAPESPLQKKCRARVDGERLATHTGRIN